MRGWCAALLALILGAQTLAAQEPGSELTVYVVTVGQGDQVWERYGHNALWIQDSARGTNDTYNWGIFDASESGFILRFVRGRMLYWMESVDIGRLLAFYRSFDRAITVQQLALTPAQRVALRDFVEWNARPENKRYWYDYFRDNCSTRVRDAIDRALGGAIRRATDGQMTAHTYRSESVRLMEGMALTQAGIALGLGPAADRRLTAWEEMFVPMRMRDRLRSVRVPGPGGSLIPLLVQEQQVYVPRRPPEIQHVPPLAARYGAVGALVAVLLAALGWRAQAGGRRACAGFAVAAAIWAAVAGIGGLLLLFLWVGTHHVFAYRNENLFQLNPLAVVLVVLAPLAVYRTRARRPAQRVAAAVVALALLGVALKAVPWVEQRNLAAIALVLPGHLALAWGLMRLGAPVVDRGATAERAAAAPQRDARVRRASAN